MSKWFTTNWGLRAGLAGAALVVASCSARGDSERESSTVEALTIGVPYRVRAIDFTAFNDSDTVHEGTCGSGPVDQQTVSDNGITCGVAYTKPGEWLEYSLQVATAGKFSFVSRVAGNATGKTIRLLIDGVAVGGSQSVPSGGWTSFADRTVNDIAMSAGTHTLRVLFETGDTNFNYVDVTPGTATLPQRIEAENYQRAFESTPASNSGNSCNRGDGVDAASTSDMAGGCLVGWATANEWLEYDVTVPTAGLYDFTARLASATAGRQLQLNVDGAPVGTVTSPSTGYNAFEDRKVQNVSLGAGPHVLRATFVQGDLNLNYIDVSVHPVVPGYSFGGSVNYNIFVFQDLSTAPSVGGPVAAGRDVIAQSFSYNTTALTTIGGLAGRNFNGTNGSIQRDLIYGNAASLNSVTMGSQGVSRKATPLDFAAEKSTLDVTTANLASLTANGTTTISSNGGIFTFTGTDPSRNVFSVDGAALSAGDQFTFSVPATSTAIVNVTGTTPAFDTASFQLGSLTESHLLWNFPNATTLRVTSVGAKGTLLAVNAATTMTSASLDGALVAGSLSGTNTGITWKPFNGALTVCSGAALSITPGSPQLVGASPLLSATATCVDNRAAEFHYDYLNSDTETTWHEVAPGFGTTPVTWSASALPAGSYQLRVLVRRVGEASLSGASVTSPFVIDKPVTIPIVAPTIETFGSLGLVDVSAQPSGWRIDKQVNPRTVGTFTAATFKTDFRAGALLPANSSNGIYNFGAGVASAQASNYWLNSNDRAPGWLSGGLALGTGGTKSGNLYVALTSPADKDITSLNVGYDIERYSNGTNPAGFHIQLYSSTDGANWTNVGSDFLNSFAVDTNNLGFDPVPGQTVNIVPKKLSASIPRNTRYYLAWNYTVDSTTSTDGSNAQAIGIDNVSIQGSETCVPDCTGRTCGSDGCGGTCGSLCGNGPTGCQKTADCVAGSVCDGSGQCLCTPNCSGKTCGDFPDDGCGGVCPEICVVNQPGCHTDVECPIGSHCGHHNGSYFGLSPEANVCWSAQCDQLDTSLPGSGVGDADCGDIPACVPYCTGKTCGPDGCGGQCGSCAGTESCSAQGACVGKLSIPTSRHPSFPPTLEDAPTVPVGAMAGNFSVSDHGSAHYSIPIVVPPGRLGLEPQLSFNYEGNKNDGMMGPGWRLSGFSAIERCVKTVAQDGKAKAVFLTQEDGFCLDGARLILGAGEQEYGAPNTWYQTELDTFSRIQLVGPIVADGKYVGPRGFKVYKKSGQVLEYGPDRNSVGRANGVARVWALAAIYDRVGGEITISYLQHTYQDRDADIPELDIAELVPESIEYGGIATSAGTIAPSRWVSFHYQDRQEARFRYANDVETFSTRYLDSVETRTAEKLVRRYALSYAPSPNSSTRLSSIRECVPDTGTGTNVCLPPTTFGYGGLQYTEVTPAVVAGGDGWRIREQLDMDGDGKDEILADFFSAQHALKDAVVLKLDLAGNSLSTTAISTHLNGSLAKVIDINRDGKDDLLTRSSQEISDGQGFAYTFPAARPMDLLADVNGDGILDVASATEVSLGDTHGDGGRLAIETPGNTPIDINGVRLLAMDLYGSGSQQIVYITNDHASPNERYVPIAQYWPANANATPPLEQSITASGVSRINEVAGVRPLWSSRIRQLDINGDGLNDILELRLVPDSVSAVYALWINKGSGYFELITPWFIGPAANRSSFLTADEFDRAVVIDYDGDGSEDLLVPQAGENNAVLYRSTMMPGPSPAFSVSISDIFIDLIGPNEKLPYLAAADINGDGNRDILFAQGGKLRAYLGSNGTAGLLSSVTNGLRKKISVTYGSSDVYDAGDCVSDEQTTCLRRVPPVVKSDSEAVVDASNHIVIPGVQHTYTYRAGRKGLGGRGFYGFAERTISTLSAEGVGQSLTRLGYHNEEFAFAGLLKVQRVTSATTSDTAFSSPQRFDLLVNYKWSLHSSASGGTFPALDAVYSAQSDAQYASDAPIPLVTRDTTYPSRNGYGDVEDEVTTTSTSADGVVDVREVVTSYKNNESSWLISRPDTVTVTDAPTGASPITRVKKYVFYSDTGVLHQTIREPNDPELYLETRYDRDGFGNVGSVHSLDSSGAERTSSFAYDDDRKLFPTSMASPIGTIEVQYDDASGHLQTSSDENQITSQRQYDGFGRLAYVRARETETKVTLAAAGLKTGMLGDMPGATEVQTSVTNGPTSVELKDALGRTLQVVSSGVAGALVAQEYSYDSLGRVLHSSVPHLPANTSQGVIDYSYDEIGRLIGRTFPDASTVSYLFASNRSAKGKARTWFSQGKTATSLQATIFPKGNLQAQLSDENGQLLTAVEAENVTAAAEAHLTKLTHGAFGTVRTVADPLGNVTTSTPDTIGRVVALDDPDQGHQTRAYSAWNEIIRTTDALNVTREFRQDSVGRLRLILDDQGNTIASWEYDGTGDNENGRLISTFRQLQPGSADGVRTTYTYEPKPVASANTGRLKSVQEELLDEAGLTRTLKTEFGFDSAGRIETISYPNAAQQSFVVRNKYDPGSGALLAVCNGQSTSCDNASTRYWKLVQTDQGQRPAVEQFGDGSVTTKSYYAIGDSAPECQSNVPGLSCLPGRLKAIVTTQSPGSSGQALNFGYHYDRNGNVAEMDTPGSSSTYEYDGFDRLHLVNAPTGNVEYDYDAIGNLTSQTELGPYTYPPAGSAWPHAVQSVDGTSFTYDANGNQIRREGNAIPDGYQHIDYNDFSMPYRVASSEDPNAPATMFEYTADQTRAAKRSPTATTLYLGGLYDRTASNGTGLISHHYKVYAGSQLVAQVTKEESSGAISNTETRFVHGDALGSTRLVAGGSSPEHRDFDAFGNPANALDDTSTTSGFTGHDHDGDLGFINMRGRLYDSRVGRFITPDPLVASFSAQDLNRYSYVRNNPLRYVDPSGFTFRMPGVGVPGGTGWGGTKTGGKGSGDSSSSSDQNISSDGALDLSGLVEYHGGVTGTAPSTSSSLGGATANGSSSGDWSGPAPDWGSASPGTGGPTSRLHDNRLAAGPPPPEPPPPVEFPNDPKGEIKPEEDDLIDPDQPYITEISDLPPELERELINQGLSLPEFLTAPGEAPEPYPDLPTEGLGKVDGSFQQCTEPPIEFFHGTTGGGSTSILSNKILPVSRNTAPFPAGSFFVHLGPNGQLAASHWAARSAQLFGDSPALLRGTMSPVLFNTMVSQGLIQTGEVPGLPFFPPQTVILPEGLDAANGGIQWSIAPLTF